MLPLPGMSTIAEYEYVHGAVICGLLRAPVKCGTHTIMVEKIVMIEVSKEKMPWGTYRIEPNHGNPKILFIAYRLKTGGPSTWQFVIGGGRLLDICKQYQEGAKDKIEVWIALVCRTDDIIKKDGWICLLSPDDINHLGVFSSCSSDSPKPITISTRLEPDKSFRVWSPRVNKGHKGSSSNPLIIPRNRLKTWLCPPEEKTSD